VFGEGLFSTELIHFWLIGTVSLLCYNLILIAYVLVRCYFMELSISKIRVTAFSRERL
jgi:hypothetical protein